MESKIKILLVVFVLLITFFGFGLIAFLVNGKQIFQFDNVIISFIQGLESERLTTIMKFFTFIGSGSSVKVLALITIIALFFFFKYRSELLLFIVVLIGSHYIFRALKQIFQRTRPDFHRLIEIGGYSFPSGHAMNAITLYGIISFLLWSRIPTIWGRTLLVIFSTFMILMIGISRIYLGVHYPSDVIASYFAGSFWLIIAIWCFQLTIKKIYERTHAK